MKLTEFQIGTSTENFSRDNGYIKEKMTIETEVDKNNFQKKCISFIE